MTRQLSHLHIETGPGGWLKAFWRRDAGPDNVIYVQFRAPKTKRQAWAIVGLKTSKDSQPPWLSASLLADVPLHRIDRAVMLSDVFRAGLLEQLDAEVPADLDSAFRRAYKETPRTPLERPPRNQLDDEFYGKVALAYRKAVAGGHPPLDTLAADSGIPRGTISRWVATARERGFLPKTTKGKVSA